MAHKYFPTFKAFGRWFALRVLPKLFLGLLVLFVLLAIPWVSYNQKWKHRLEAELASLRAQGAPLSIVEAAPKAVPEDQNAAAVYQEVFQCHYPPEAGRPPAAGLTALDDKSLSIYPEIPTPAWERHVGETLYRPDVRRALEVLRQGSQRPYCVFPVNWQDGPGAEFAHMGRFRPAARLIAAQALFDARQGRTKEALDWLAVGFRMSTHAGSESTMISQLVQYAAQAILLSPVREIICDRAVPSGVSRELASVLADVDLDQPFVRAMDGARAFGIMGFDIARTKPGLLNTLPPEARNHLLVRLYYSRLGRPWHYRDELAYLDLMERQIEAVKPPYRLARRELESIQARANNFPEYSVTRVLLPMFSWATQKRDHSKAKVDLCRVVLALKGYKAERGEYPTSLDQLQGTLEWKVSEDPFSGKSFVYRRKGDGFLLYSLGMDMDDDGGRPERDAKGKWHLEDSDIVWDCGQ